MMHTIHGPQNKQHKLSKIHAIIIISPLGQSNLRVWAASSFPSQGKKQKNSTSQICYLIGEMEWNIQ